MKRRFFLPPFALAIILMFSSPMDVQAQQSPRFVAQVEVTEEVVTFELKEGDYLDFLMTVAGPDDFRLEQSFSGDQTPSLGVKTEQGLLPDGAYTVEMVARPKFSDAHRAALEKARHNGDRYAMQKLMDELGFDPAAMVFTTYLGVADGAFVLPNEEESRAEATNTAMLEAAPPGTPLIDSVHLTGRRWDAAYLPNTPGSYIVAPDVTATAVLASASEQAPPFVQRAPDPAAAWYEATFDHTAEDGTPLTYQGFLRPVVAEGQGKRFEVYLRKADGVVYGPWQQGYFQADEGGFRAANQAHAAQPFDYVTEENPDEAARVVFHAADGSIIGSLCVGGFCPVTPSFGFDTIRLSENNLRLHYDDTSSTASFPLNDWRVRINDSANGGASYYAVEDATSGNTPFRIVAGARHNALYVDAQGDVGIGTSSPAVDLVVKRGDSPTLRLEQDGTGGFGAQIWDIAGNETNFFVRDVTSGNTLPFRIRPGAPASALDIHSDGDVGINTDAPGAKLHVLNASGDGQELRLEATAEGANVSLVMKTATKQWGMAAEDGTGDLNFINTVVAGNPMELTDVGNLIVLGDYFSTACPSPGSPCAPDYVFEDEYPLLSLEELAAFVETNHHLPNVPSESDLREAGVINHSTFQMTLLEKIEELTLYTLEQQKTIQDLQTRLKKLEASDK